MSASFREKTVRSLAVVGGSQVVIRLISFATTIIMARILSPEDYGVMALASVVIGFVAFFNEVGISAAVVQRQDITETELAGCFYLSSIFGSLCWLATFLLGYYSAIFFEVELLQQIVPILGIGLLTGSLHSVSVGLMRKELRFNELSVIGIVAVIVSAIVTLAFALFDYGVWSLVFGSVASSLFRTVAIVLRSGWIPGIFGGIRQGLPIALYGLNITYTRVLWFIYSSADNAIIGKVLGEAMLGFYSMAFTLATLPSSHITGLVVNVSSPVFSKLQGDAEAIRSNVVNFIKGIAYVSFPALAGLAVVANELVVVVIGEKWAASIVPFQILCVLGFWKSIDPILTQVLISTGHAKQVAKYTSVCAVIIPLVIYFGSVYGGLNGAALAWVIAYPLLSVYLLRIIRNILGITTGEILAPLMVTLLNTGLMVISVLIVRWLLLDLQMNVAIVLVAEIITGLVVYSGLLIRNRGCLSDIKMFLSDLGISQQKLNIWPLRNV